MRILIYASVLTMLASTSCQQNKQRQAKEIVAEWLGREIKFPQNLECLRLDNAIQCPKTNSDNYRILLYADSAGCLSCRLGLELWKELIAESDTMFSRKPDFLFVFQPKHDGTAQIEQVIRLHEFKHPVIPDFDDKIFALNHFSDKTEYQCFLLDKDNKVVITGNPVYNSIIRELYKKTVNKGNSEQETAK